MSDWLSSNGRLDSACTTCNLLETRRRLCLPARLFAAGPTRPVCYSPVCQFPRLWYVGDIVDIGTTTHLSEPSTSRHATCRLPVVTEAGQPPDLPSAPSRRGLRFRWGKILNGGEKVCTSLGQWRTSRRQPGLPRLSWSASGPRSTWRVGEGLLATAKVD